MGYYYRVKIDTNPMPISYSIEHSLTSSTNTYIVSPIADHQKEEEQANNDNVKLVEIFE